VDRSTHLGPWLDLSFLKTLSASASLPLRGTSSHSRWSAGCIIATHDAQPEPKSRSHATSDVSMSCAHRVRLRRMPRSMRACRTVGNARKAPNSGRWFTFAIIAAHSSRADNVLRNDRCSAPWSTPATTSDLPQGRCQPLPAALALPPSPTPSGACSVARNAPGSPNRPFCCHRISG